MTYVEETVQPSSSNVEVTIVQVPVSDPRVGPLIRELGEEYSARYGKDAHTELSRYPDEEFTAPHGGALILLLERGEPVAGGAFRRYDPETAELKRIWTHSAHRRRGLARRVVAELERVARERGYRRIYLTTGPRQPEARGLYLVTGYTPLFDTEAAPETLGLLPFEKRLPESVPEDLPSDLPEYLASDLSEHLPPDLPGKAVDQ